MNEKELTRKSRLLSLVLRHKPEELNLTLDEKGWADVKSILKHPRFNITLDELKHIVENNDKKRFEFNDNLTKIRARQGHSIEVDVELKEYIPVKSLYHGTAWKSTDSIFKSGLSKQSRQHVHMSDNTITALSVGQRYGNPVIILVDAVAMHNDGYKFFKSNNDVYLTDNVPAKYLSIYKEVELDLEDGNFDSVTKSVSKTVNAFFGQIKTDNTHTNQQLIQDLLNYIQKNHTIELANLSVSVEKTEKGYKGFVMTSSIEKSLRFDIHISEKAPS